MTLKALHANDVDSISALVEETIGSGAMSQLLLFDEGMEPLHDQFLLAYLRNREDRYYDFVVGLPGELMHDEAQFFREVRRAVPLADYMGGNFDAVTDVFRVEGLSRDPFKRTYWIWQNSHVLYTDSPAQFAIAFEVLAATAREARAGHVDSSGAVKPPWTHWSPQPVVLLLTAAWEAMGKEASDPHSFLYRLPPMWSPLFPDLSTGLTSFRIQRDTR